MLAKKYRLTKNGSFQYVYRAGKSGNEGAISLTFVLSKGAPRLGFSVPNKVGKAVVRNKIKRRMRAAAARFLPRLKAVQAVFSARNGADKLSYTQIEAALEKLSTRANLFKGGDV